MEMLINMLTVIMNWYLPNVYSAASCYDIGNYICPPLHIQCLKV